MTTYTTTLDNDKQVTISVSEFGDGSPVLLLHGGAGPQSVMNFAQRLASEDNAHVYVPTHPGFGGTPRPEWLNNIGALAESYIALIEQLNLQNVTVIGNSIGGWIASEMAIRGSTHISKFILMDAVEIVVEGQPVQNIFKLSFDEIAQFSYYAPAAFRIDPSAMTDVQKAGMAANRQTLALYAGSMADTSLLQRLGTINTPTLILWGDSDRIVTPEYGQAFASAIPTATFKILPKTGHLPHLETPDQTLSAVRDFVNAPANISH